MNIQAYALAFTKSPSDGDHYEFMCNETFARFIASSSCQNLSILGDKGARKHDTRKSGLAQSLKAKDCIMYLYRELVGFDYDQLICNVQTGEIFDEAYSDVFPDAFFDMLGMAKRRKQNYVLFGFADNV